MRGHYVIVLLAFAVGSQTVGAQNLGTCLNSLTKSIDAGTDKCTAWEDYVNCFLWGINADTTFTTDAEIQALQTTVQNDMYKQGVYCSINVRDILTEIKQERQNGVTRTTARPLRFNESTNSAECSNAMGTAIPENGRMSCDVFKSFIKCVIRVENVYYRPSYDMYQKLDDLMQDQMSKLNIYCAVDARSMIEEVARENGYTTPLPRTTAPYRARVTTPARARITTTTRAAPSLDSRFTSARTISDCQTIAVDVEKEVGLGSCSVWRSGLKCLIRVTGAYKVTDPNMRSRLQSLVDSTESTYGIHCTEDMDVLLQEVRQEQGFNSGTKLGIKQEKGFNSGTKLGIKQEKGFNSGTKLGTNVVVSLTLTVSVIVSFFLGVH